MKFPLIFKDKGKGFYIFLEFLPQAKKKINKGQFVFN